VQKKYLASGGHKGVKVSGGQRVKCKLIAHLFTIAGSGL